MPIKKLDHTLRFPPVERANSYGLLAFGGDLSLPRLELAYRSGIFPWYSEGDPILWYAPDPRMVLPINALVINRSLRKAIRKKPYTLRMDTAFRSVITACARIPRPGQHGTWITRELRDAFCDFHDYGLAHSVEAWQDDKLVGGLYGVSIGAMFFGESMFALAPNASKIAFVALAQQLMRWGIDTIDCQVYTEHLERFGAYKWPRPEFMEYLEKSNQHPTKKGHWRFDQDFEIEL